MVISLHWFGAKKNRIPLLKTECPLFVKPWVPFTRGSFVPSLFENGRVLMEKKILKLFQFIFCYFIIISPWKMWWPFIWTNLHSPHPQMFCAELGSKWPRGSGVEDFYTCTFWRKFRNIVVTPVRPSLCPSEEFLVTWATSTSKVAAKLYNRIWLGMFCWCAIRF